MTSGLSATSTSGSSIPTISTEIDILRDTMRTYAAPFQSQAAVAGFTTTQGLTDSLIESQIASSLGGPNANSVNSSYGIFSAAVSAGIPVVAITSLNLSTLSTLDIPADAKARIAQEVGAGNFVFVPSTTMNVNGTPSISWLEGNVATNSLISVSEDGTHGAGISGTAGTYAIFVPLAVLGIEEAAPALIEDYGAIAAANFTSVVNLNLVQAVGEDAAALEAVSVEAAEASFKAFAEYLGTRGGINGYYLIKYIDGAENFFNQYKAYLLGDPPLANLVFELPPLPQFASLGLGATNSGVATGVVNLPSETVPYADTQLPTVFVGGIRNTSSSTQTYSLSVSDLPAGFTSILSIDTITLAAGQTGQVGISLIPDPGQPLPAPGTILSFTFTATVTPGTSVSSTANESFTVPAIEAVTVRRCQSRFLRHAGRHELGRYRDGHQCWQRGRGRYRSEFDFGSGADGRELDDAAVAGTGGVGYGICGLDTGPFDTAQHHVRRNHHRHIRPCQRTVIDRARSRSGCGRTGRRHH